MPLPPPPLNACCQKQKKIDMNVKLQILADFVSTLGCDRATLMFVDTPAQVSNMGSTMLVGVMISMWKKKGFENEII